MKGIEGRVMRIFFMMILILHGLGLLIWEGFVFAHMTKVLLQGLLAG